MKKILMTLLVLSVALLLAACGNQESGSQPEVPQHEHTYATEWSKDANNHWHAASCEHTEEVSEKAAHTWNSGEVTKAATVDAKGEKTYTCTVCGQTKIEEIAKLDPPAHEHAHATEWSSDENEHWHECECGDKADKAAHAVAETKYENGYKVEACACGKEMSKVAHLTYVITNCNDATKLENGHIDLSEEVYSATLTVAAWDVVTLYYEGSAISSTSVTMLPGTAWEGGAWAGVVYQLYHDGNTTGFISPTGGDYKFAYNVTENTLLLGDYVEPAPAGTFAVSSTTADAGANKIAVFATAGDVIKANNGAYPYHPGQWDPYRLFIVVDADGKIAYMCLMPIKGYGNPIESSYARHSDYSDYKTNPAFANLSDEYQGAWGMTVDWSLVVPEGGFVISAHGDAATAIGQFILNNPNFVGTDDYEPMVNDSNINVDSIRISYNADETSLTVTTA